MSIKQRISNRPKLWASTALVTAGLAGGAILGTTMTAGATTSTTTPASSSSSSGSTTPAANSGSSSSGSSATPPAMPPHGSAAHEDAETPVTGADAAKAQAAAVKYVGSGTAGPVTTDYTKTGYEVTVTKPDGTTVEVHEDSSFTVIQGGPGRFGPGGPGGPPPGWAPNGSSSSGSSSSSSSSTAA